MCAPHSAHLGWKMRLGMISYLRITFHLTGHCQRHLHAVFREAPKFVGDAEVGVPQRRFVEYDRARQEPLDSHQSLKHGVKLTEVLSQSLDTSGIRLGYSDNQGSECPHLGVERT